MDDHGIALPLSPALRWENDADGPAVVLLDQTRLPAAETELACRDVPALVAAIQTLAVRGAPLLGIAGAYGVALAAVRGDDVEAAAALLADARPTAVNLAYGVTRALAAYREALGERGDLVAAASVVLEAARELHVEDARAAARMAGHGRGLLRELVPGDGYRLLTHCNTGVLVSGGEGTALGVVLAAHRDGALARLWIDETRPLLQGARLTAWEAARFGMPHTLLADNAAGSLLASGQVDAVLVGADRIAADGSTANKVGTYPLAVLARHHGVPFLVVAPTTTVDLGTPDGGAIHVEQRDAGEVTHLPVAPRTPVAPAGTLAYNPAFDVTPPELITAIVTENGVASPVNGKTLAALVDAGA
ncbi:S-methyl-5-thioribose-1-phosphate isomerase [Streptomyces sp. SL13]|uniref:Methylthioribose-1-phosphate isomerase n=1 Tax=Streptantibioticus silvisoli TaxID=2705255 RepID=A0AA90KAL5_9ACTN|nr:S-methyl-5-thioribose-1-phosphate isomerase [Streptantibioticus silvisoli]MDI5972568.1 S-methyl-5-thioribose-1-phosphate isomerase [Streptantibioticus silvisoli]